MSILEMKVPSPGESITEVEIATWLVKDGDYVEKDQAIAEVDSDKATLELPAEASGIITLKAEEGDAVAVGQVVCLIDTGAAKPSGSAPAAEAPKAEEKKDDNVKINIVNENNTWNSGFSVSTSDFASIDTTKVLASRNSDGSIAESSLLHLSPGSQLIGSGTDLTAKLTEVTGRGYSIGNTKDIGYIEYSSTTAVKNIKEQWKEILEK